MVIAVDFDGTIVEHRYPEIGEERPFAVETLKKLQEQRHKLILWTVREGELLDAALEWCKARGLEFYAVNSDSSDMFNEAKDKNLSCKLNADVFIDDRNVGGIPDWGTIYKIISTGRTYQQVLRDRISHEMGQLEEPPAPKWMFWKSHRNSR
ncbi:MAG: hypothetical protein K6E54_05510 [Bacteroidaceae bacterium]|nr:hypothetical protein [Bacteroidaceae bacterium]